MIKTPLEELDILLALLVNYHAEIQGLENSVEKISKACDIVGRSWSNSFAGYHGLLYFLEFNEPELNSRFSSEWGGTMGIPNGWVKKTSDQVREKIEQLSGEDIKIEDIKKACKEIVEKIKDLHQEILIQLSAIDKSKIDLQENDLINQVSLYEFEKKLGFFMKKMMPNQIVTRDSGALMEGICTPSHLYYKGVALQVIDSIKSIYDFTKLISRLIRQLKMKQFLTVKAAEVPSRGIGNTVFIVHGHDQQHIKESVARLVTKLSMIPIILHEKPNQGRTIIEKFEDYAENDFAVALLTGDDIGCAKDAKEHSPRARQNVLLELGYFLGKFGRKKVFVLHQAGVEIPSDYSGVLYIPIDDSGKWQYDLARELKAAGANIDLNLLA